MGAGHWKCVGKAALPATYTTVNFCLFGSVVGTEGGSGDIESAGDNGIFILRMEAFTFTRLAIPEAITEFRSYPWR